MSDETTDGADKKTELVGLFKEIHRFTSPLSQHLQVIENRLTGLQEHNVSALSALINLHRMGFRMSVARDPEEADESDSITTFLSAIAGELEPYVDIVIPKVNDTLNLDTMKVLDREITDRPDLHNTVCGILQCGYRANSIAGGNVFEKASVAAFKFEGVITAVDTSEDAIFESEKYELGNSSNGETGQITTSVKDIVLLSVCAIALFFVMILFVQRFFDGTDYTTLNGDMQTISKHVYAGRYGEARRLLDKHKDWGNLEQWSIETREYCDERKANHQPSDGAGADSSQNN